MKAQFPWPITIRYWVTEDNRLSYLLINMISETLLLVSIDHLDLIDTLPRFNFNHFVLGKEREHIKQWAHSDSKVFVNFGQNNLNLLLSNPFFFKYIDQKQLKELQVPNFETLSQLDVISIEWFFFHSWLVKDNSINLKTYFAHNPSEGRYLMRSRGMQFSNCKGLFEDVSFTTQELEKCLELHGIVYELSGSLKFDGKVKDSEAAKGKGIQSSGINEVNYNDHNRLTRALLFLQGARTTTLLPLKISFYIGVLECLFSISDGEISHKVAERVALYLGSDFTQRDKFFKQIKTVYDIRSKFIHGQILPKGSRTSEELITKSSEIDEILRKLLNKILAQDVNTFNGDDSTLNAFFLGLMFK